MDFKLRIFNEVINPSLGRGEAGALILLFLRQGWASQFHYLAIFNI